MKKLVNNEIGRYIFNQSSKTIKFLDCGNIKLENILVITNVTKHIMLYNFADETLTGTLSNNILTLGCSTDQMSDSDELQIFLDVPDDSIKNSLANLVNGIFYPAWFDRSLNRLRATVVAESCGTVSSVTTVGNISSIGGFSATAVVTMQNQQLWSQLVRSKIT